MNIGQLWDECRRARKDQNESGTYTIVYGRQDFVVEVTSGIRVSDRKGNAKGLEHVPRVGDVDDQEVCTLVSDCTVRSVSSTVCGEVAECARIQRRSAMITDLTRMNLRT